MHYFALHGYHHLKCSNMLHRHQNFSNFHNSKRITQNSKYFSLLCILDRVEIFAQELELITDKKSIVLSWPQFELNWAKCVLCSQLLGKYIHLLATVLLDAWEGFKEMAAGGATCNIVAAAALRLCYIYKRILTSTNWSPSSPREMRGLRRTQILHRCKIT